MSDPTDSLTAMVHSHPSLEEGVGTAGAASGLSARGTTVSSDRPSPGTRNIIIHPLGYRPFPSLARAVELSKPGSRRSFALVVPTKPALEHAKNEVARLAGGTYPFAFFTILGLARKILGEDCPGFATATRKDAILERALEEIPSEDLRAARKFRGLRRDLLGLFSELETLSVEPKAFEAMLGRSRPRNRRKTEAEGEGNPAHARLALAYAAYRAALSREGLAVEADILRLATRALENDRSALALPEVLLVDGFVDLAPGQLDLISALAAKVEEASVHWLDAGSSTLAGEREAETTLARGKRALEGRGFVEWARDATSPSPRSAAVEHVLGNLFRETEPQAFAGDARGSVSFVRAGSPADEAACVMRIARARIARGRSWNDVLVVVPNARSARARFERAARDLSVPIRVHAPRPLLSSPVARGALAFLRAAMTLETAPLLHAAAVPALGLDADEADRFTQDARRRGLPGGRIALESTNEKGLMGDAIALARSLREGGSLLPPPDREAGGGRAGVGGGPVTCESSTTTTDPHPCPPPASQGEGGSYLHRVDAPRALGLARKALSSRLGRPVLRDLARAPLEAEIEAASDEVAACGRLEALLLELEEAFSGQSLPLDELLRRTEEELASAEYLPRDRRRHVVHVVSVDEARSWAAPVVVLAGLSEGTFPRPPRDDLVLDDPSRRALAGRGARLATLDDFALGERLLFLLAVACARDELHFVHAGFDDSGEPTPASPFLASVLELFAKRSEEGPVVPEGLVVKRSPSDVVPASLSELATVEEARRFAYLRVAASFTAPEAENRARAGAALLELMLAEPSEADRAREALLPRRWELVRGLGFDPLARVYSASELETYATCPYRHFVQNVLGVRRRDDLSVTGVDSRIQGKIVHDALERAIERHESPEAAFDAAFAAAVRELPVHEIEVETFRRAARAAVIAFLREDDPAFLARAGLDRSRGEVAFGPDQPVGPLRVQDPLLGGDIQLEGRIDRIDEGKDGAFVTDYKLGTDELDRAARNELARGQRLQLPVYLLAIERVLGKRPLGAALVALGSRRRTGIVAEPRTPGAKPSPLVQETRRVSLAAVDLEGLLRTCEDTIRAIVRGIASGTIDASPRSPQDCRRCDVKDVCRFRERPRTAPEPDGRKTKREEAPWRRPD